MTQSRSSFVLVLLALIVFVVNVFGTYSALTAQYPGHNDFMSRWEGARSFWQDGLNPYGEQASLNIQYAIYGKPATALQDPGYFAYPFYTVFLLLPITGIGYAWASAFWMVLLEACLIAALLLLINLFEWRPKPLMLGALIIWTLLAYYPARGLLLGQPGLLVYLLEVVAVWALARRRDTLAAAALVISTIKPQMGYLIVPFLLLWGLREGRWRFVSTFIIFFGGLMLASFALVPSWLGDWLAQLQLYPQYTELGSPVWILSHYPWLGQDATTGKWGIQGGFGSIIETALTIGAYGHLLYLWYGALIQRKHERWLWTVVMTLIITHLVAPRTATPHYVIFIMPLIFYLKWVTQPRIRRGNLYALLVLLALLVLPWLHFLVTVVDRFEHPAVYLPVPFFAFGLVWATRKMWWNSSHAAMHPTAEIHLGQDLHN